MSIVLVIVIFLIGCSLESDGQEKQETNTEENTPINQEQLIHQVQQLSEENHELTQQMTHLENEKREFLIADRFGRELYQAMVLGDQEKLHELTATSDLNVFDNRFELQVGEELVEIPFSHLQTEAHLNHQVIVKTNGFGLDQDEQMMRIHYAIIEPEKSSQYFLNVNLVKVDTLEWSVQDVEFDI